MKIRSPPAKLRQRITDHFLIAFLNFQLASRNPFSGQIVADYFFFARFTDPPPSTCTLTFARSFAKLSRKYPYSQTPAISGGRIEGNANTRGLGVWLLQSLPFGNLAAACGPSFLTLEKASLGSDSGRCKDVLQDHGVWLSRSLTFGSSAATYEATTQASEPEPNRNSMVPFS